MKTREPLVDLAAIVRQINVAAYERHGLGALLDALAASEIFDAVAGLTSAGSSRPFVVIDARGDRASVAGWQRWPLRRLFDTMMVRKILHPRRRLSALAIPLDYGEEKCVVLAHVCDWAYGPAFEPFFETLENFRVARSEPKLVLAEGIPQSPVDPRIVCFAMCPELQVVVDSILARRGWSRTVATTHPELRTALESTHADMLVLDLNEQLDSMETLLRIHAYLPAETWLIAFGQEAQRNFETQAIVDALIAHDAGEAEFFPTLKRYSRRVEEVRKTHLREMTTGFERALRDSQTPQEVSTTSARHAAGVMCGWASVHLVSESGATYTSEHPRQRVPVLSALPKAFLSDAPFYQLRADERFYREISDDRRVVGALERLHPVSAASIPLRHGDRHIGTLVSVSCDVVVDSSAFEALDGFAKLVARRFEDFTQPNRLNSFVEHNGVWECVRHSALDFAAYRSRSSPVGWDYRTMRRDFGLLIVGDKIDFPQLRDFAPPGPFAEERLARFIHQSGDRRLFLAACDPIGSTVAYAARGFPVPLLFDAVGPAGALSARDSIVRGSLKIAPPAGLLVLDSPMQRWLIRESLEARSVTEVVEDLRPPGVAIVVTRAAVP